MHQKMSRRTVLIGLGGAAALAATGGVVYLAASRQIVKPDPHHLLTYTGHPYGPSRAAWSPDGTRVASIGELDATVQVWQASTGKKLLACTLGAAAANTYPRDVMWSTDGKSVLAVVAETKDLYYTFIRTVQVWDAATGQRLHSIPIAQEDQSIPESQASAVAWDVNTRYLSVATNVSEATNQSHGLISIWDITSGSNIATLDTAAALTASTALTPASSTPTPPSTPTPGSLPTPPSSTPTPGGTPVTLPQTLTQELLWAPDSGKLAVISLSSRSGAGIPALCQIWDVPAGKVIRTFNLATQADWVIAWSFDGQSIALGPAIYAVETGSQIMGYAVAGRMTAQALSPDARRLAVRSATEGGIYQPSYSSIYLVDAPIGRQLAKYNEGQVARGESSLESTRKMIWSPDGKTLLVVGGGVEVWRGTED